MSKYFAEDISNLTDALTQPEFMMLSLLSCKINVLVVGGGRAGLIKANTYAKRGAKVFVVSKDFCDELIELSKSGSLTLINDSYKLEYIVDKHIVIIATMDKAVNDEVMEHCNKMAKIYLTCADYSDGLFVTPTQIDLDNLCFAIHTKGASPKTTKFISERIGKVLSEYDEFVEYACEIRNIYKGSHLKEKILNIINTEEFYLAFKNGKHEELLNSIYK